MGVQGEGVQQTCVVELADQAEGISAGWKGFRLKIAFQTAILSPIQQGARKSRCSSALAITRAGEGYSLREGADPRPHEG